LRSSREIPGFGSASIKGTWEFKKGTTGAVLLMHNPRIKGINGDVLGKLSKIELLKQMHLVIRVFYCPAYSMYLSDKSEYAIPKEMICTHPSAGGEKIAIALLGSAAVAGAPGIIADGVASMSWWSNTQSGLSRRGCKTEHCFTPLYDLKHVRYERHRRASPSPERKGEELCVLSFLP
jgi:hypothetical protein